jgi:hypothetical protein
LDRFVGDSTHAFFREGPSSIQDVGGSKRFEENLVFG